jgi:arginyl-tRNA synthetase
MELNNNIELAIEQRVKDAVKDLFGQEPETGQVQVQKTRKDFKGDFTIVVFPLLKISRKKPEETGTLLGNYLQKEVQEVQSFNVVKGFLNLELKNSYWEVLFRNIYSQPDYGITTETSDGDPYMVEYSSPNTNKPLHLGHIRNNLLGFSVSKILEANGHKVIKTNIVNDRGIHICKSMLAWDKWGKGETPDSSGKKGDHLVGDYYVKFDQEYKKEINEIVAKGVSEEDAKKQAPLILEAQEMLRRWERGDEEVMKLWKMMNGWVYEGFDITYRELGVGFDKIYYESETFKLGKKIVEEALKKKILFSKEDGSVWADLTEDGLDEKLLLRSDGTAVYMTQDLGTAVLRYRDYHFDEHVYVVGNEQNYHFQVLKLVLKKMDFSWADKLYHLSYGMVELPEGKMKSREGTVVDADDLVKEMYDTAREMSEELGKLDEYKEEEKKEIYRKIGLGALKYFILKVDPKKNMTFDPRESVDFNGNTGPFIQYTYARIQSVLRKAKERSLEWGVKDKQEVDLNLKEKELVKLIRDFATIVQEAGRNFSPALIANYTFELVKEYNQFYHDFSILREENQAKRNFRLCLSEMAGRVIESGMNLLGIEVPERM